MDTSAFVAGFDPFSIYGEQYIVPQVKEEVTEKSMSGVRLEMAIGCDRVKVRTPGKFFVSEVEKSATSLGDAFFLSETDTQLLALALELRTSGFVPLVVTDDYSMQNVADQMGIEFTSLLTFGIRRRWQWARYCPACHAKYTASTKAIECKICGTELKRKPVGKHKLSERSGPTEKGQDRDISNRV